MRWRCGISCPWHGRRMASYKVRYTGTTSYWPCFISGRDSGDGWASGMVSSSLERSLYCRPGEL